MKAPSRNTGWKKSETVAMGTTIPLSAQAFLNDGYEVIEACDGTELLDLLADVAAFARRRPDVIVSDVMMPGYSGLSVLAALRGLGLPVVLITARRDAEVEEDALRLGASAVVRKPLDFNDLRAAIMRAASASRSRRARRDPMA